MEMKAAVIIPTYNESENLRILIPKIIRNVKNVQVIVVDDNSQDDTNMLLAKFSKNNKNIVLLKRKKKMGRGTAVLHGFSFALKNTTADIFIEMDADLSHDPDELQKLIKLANGKHIAIASRYLKKSKIVGSPLYRKVLSKSANAFNTFLFGLPIHDNTNGYRAYPRTAIGLLLKYKYKSTGFVTISESTYYLYKQGFELKEMPTTFVNRRIGGSKADLHEIYISLRDLLKIRFA